MYLYGGDLKPPNNEVVPARRVFRRTGMDVMVSAEKVIVGNIYKAQNLYNALKRAIMLTKSFEPRISFRRLKAGRHLEISHLGN